LLLVAVVVMEERADRRTICGLESLGMCAAQALDHDLLNLGGADPGQRSRFPRAALEHRLADVIAVAALLADRVGRRHPVAPVIEDQADQERPARDPLPPPLDALGRELGHNGIPKLQRDRREPHHEIGLLALRPA
jgi:hypothetical protein